MQILASNTIPNKRNQSSLEKWLILRLGQQDDPGASYGRKGEEVANKLKWEQNK